MEVGRGFSRKRGGVRLFFDARCAETVGRDASGCGAQGVGFHVHFPRVHLSQGQVRGDGG